MKESPVTSTLLAYLTYFHSSSLMVNIYSFTHLTYMYFVYTHYYIFYLSVYCRMRGWSHTLGKRSAKLSSLLTFITSSWWRQLSWHIALIFTVHLWSMVSIYSLTYLTYFVYAYYYLLSCLYIAGCTNSLTFLARRSTYLRSLYHPYLRHVNSPGISHLFSQLISDGEHLSSNMSHLFCFCPLLSFICLFTAGCVDGLTLLARYSAKLSSLLTFITS